MKMRSFFIAVLLVLAVRPATAQDDTFSAQNDQYTTPWDAVLTVAAPGLIQNDSYAASDTVTARLAIEPTIGSVTVEADGGFTFTPAPDAQGPVTFVYGLQRQDGTESYAVVTVDVTAGNKAPLAIDDYYSTLTHQRLEVPAPGLLANDIDTDGDAMTVELLTTAGSGILVAQPDGSFWYEPHPLYSGRYTIRYRVTDEHGASSEGFLYLSSVSPSAPVAQPDQMEAFVGQTTGMRVIDNDTDADGNPLRIISVTQPDLGSVDFDHNGYAVFTAPAETLGRTTFSYTITDGVHEASATVTVDITDGDEPPVVTNDQVVVSVGDTARFNPLSNDYDPNGRVLQLEWTSTPEFGSIRRWGVWEYTPNAGSEGSTEVLTYLASDGYHSTEGTVTIYIEPSNRPPVVNNETMTARLGWVVSLVQVLSNDYDLDNDRLSISRFTTTPAENITIYLDDSSRVFTFQIGRPGTYVVEYWVTDGTVEVPGTLTITVAGDPQSIARDDAYTITQGTGLRLNTFANDVYYEHTRNTAPEHTANVPGALTYHDGDFYFLASSPFIGETQFTYTLPGGSTATVTLNIVPAE